MMLAYDRSGIILVGIWIMSRRLGWKGSKFWWRELTPGCIDGVACHIFLYNSFFARSCQGLSLTAFLLWRRRICAKLVIFPISSRVSKKWFTDTVVFFFGSDRNMLIIRIHKGRSGCRARRKNRKKIFHKRGARDDNHINTRAIVVHREPQKVTQNRTFQLT